MVFRMVATDLDGTIVRSDGSISDRTVSALRRAHDSGAMVVFATGRPPRWLSKVVRDTGITGPVVCSNGAQVYDTATRRITIEHLLEPPVTREVASDIRSHFSDAAFAAEIGTDFACEVGFGPDWDPPSDTRLMDFDELTSKAMVKLMAHHPASEPDALLDAVRRIVGTRAAVTRSIAISLVEVCKKGIDKASSLSELASAMGIDRGEVLAFGDQTNDAPMLAWAGHSVAVANAHPEAVGAACETTASVEEDGVAMVLERLFGL